MYALYVVLCVALITSVLLIQFTSRHTNDTDVVGETVDGTSVRAVRTREKERERVKGGRGERGEGGRERGSDRGREREGYWRE